jgi:hypothetical protein
MAHMTCSMTVNDRRILWGWVAGINGSYDLLYDRPWPRDPLRLGDGDKWLIWPAIWPPITAGSSEAGWRGWMTHMTCYMTANDRPWPQDPLRLGGGGLTWPSYDRPMTAHMTSCLTANDRRILWGWEAGARSTWTASCSPLSKPTPRQSSGSGRTSLSAKDNFIFQYILEKRAHHKSVFIATYWIFSHISAST